MSKERPNDDPRNRTDWKPYKGTDAPWKDAGQASQNPRPTEVKPNLERWQDSDTH